MPRIFKIRRPRIGSKHSRQQGGGQYSDDGSNICSYILGWMSIILSRTSSIPWGVTGHGFFTSITTRLCRCKSGTLGKLYRAAPRSQPSPQMRGQRTSSIENARTKVTDVEIAEDFCTKVKTKLAGSLPPLFSTKCKFKWSWHGDWPCFYTRVTQPEPVGAVVTQVICNNIIPANFIYILYSRFRNFALVEMIIWQARDISLNRGGTRTLLSLDTFFFARSCQNSPRQTKAPNRMTTKVLKR